MTELPFLKDDEALYRSHLEIKIKEDLAIKRIEEMNRSGIS